MAWPASPLTAYIANNVPVIKASDLNAFQDWINALTNNTVSILGLGFDGLGGLAVLPKPSALRWTNTGGVNRGNPASNSPLLNELQAVNVPKAWGTLKTVGPAPNLVQVEDGANLAGATLPGANKMNIAFAQPLADANWAPSIFAFISSGEQVFPKMGAWTNAGFELDFTGATRDAAGNLLDIDPLATPVWVRFHIFGRQNS